MRWLSSMISCSFGDSLSRVPSVLPDVLLSDICVRQLSHFPVFPFLFAGKGECWCECGGGEERKGGKKRQSVCEKKKEKLTNEKGAKKKRRFHK